MKIDKSVHELSPEPEKSSIKAKEYIQSASSPNKIDKSVHELSPEPESSPIKTKNDDCDIIPSTSSPIKSKTSEHDLSPEPEGSTSDDKPKRKCCPYGSACTRKNPVHFQDESHPGDSDYKVFREDFKLSHNITHFVLCFLGTK